MKSLPTIARQAAAPTVAATLLLLLGALGGGLNGPGQLFGASRAPAWRQGSPSAGAAAPVLARRSRLYFDRSVSATLDERGGTLFLPAGGLLVVVPAGALEGPTTITATALKGGLVAYELGPRDVRLRVPVEVYQDLDATEAPAAAELGQLEAGSFADRATLDQAERRARIDAFVPTRVGTFGRTVRFEVSHLAGYVIATHRESLE